MNSDYHHPTPADGHDYHTNFLKVPVNVNCPVCRQQYDNHDCHAGPEDGCQACSHWRQLMDEEQTKIDHVQADVDDQHRRDAEEMMQYDLSSPYPEDIL